MPIDSNIHPTVSQEQHIKRSAAVVDMAESAAKLGYFVFDPVARKTISASTGVQHIVDQVYDGEGSVSLEMLFASVHEADRALVFERVNETIDKNIPLDVEFRVVGKSGEVFYLWLSDTEIDEGEDGLVRVGIVQDLTERRVRELELYENTALRQAITDAALDAIVIIDAEGIIREFNPNAEQLFGYSKNEAVGLPIAKTIIPERYRDAHEAGMQRYLSDGSERVIGKRVEIEAIKRDGSEFPIELTVLPVKAGGRLLFTANIRDITERRQAEDQLKHAKEAAEAASKAKSEFLAAMSHEIRTPLNGVLGVLTLISDTNLDDEQQRLLKTAYASGQNLFTLISDVLDLSKIEAGRMEHEFVDFNPVTIAREAVDLANTTAAEKAIDLRLDVQDEIPSVRSDQAQIRQILTNLVANAVKFTSKGFVCVNVKSSDGRLRYEVVDTGIGIATDDQGKLFQKFSQVDPSSRRRYGGTGLGLAICRELVQRLDGEIGVQSNEGEGSVFWFEVPVAKATEEIEDVPIGLDVSPQIKIDARILLAEDSQTNALVATGFLKAVGAKVDVATNGLEVLEAAANHKYDIIVMDVSMPEMDGIEATEALRARPGWTQSVPIVALTANASQEDKQACLAVGMTDFLTKPIERSKLIKGVAQLLVDQRRKNEPPELVRGIEDLTGADPVFDVGMIRENFAELPDLFASIIEAYEAELFERIERAEVALEKGDAKSAGREGHGLKGASSNVFAKQIAVTAMRLEDAGLARDVVAAKVALEQLRGLAEIAKFEIRKLPFVKAV